MYVRSSGRYNPPHHLTSPCCPGTAVRVFYHFLSYLVITEEVIYGAPARLGLLLEGPEPFFHFEVGVASVAKTYLDVCRAGGGHDDNGL